MSRQELSRPRRVAAIVIAALTVAMAAPFAALAEPATPDTPTNSIDAKQQWLAASREAAILNERVLQARETVTAATATALAAADSVATARVEVDAATAASAAAAAEMALQQQRVDRFVNASFRGARLSSLAPLLTSESPDDFLDQAASLDRVAADAAATLDRAAQARQATDAAAEHLGHAVAEATQWQSEADDTRLAAERAAAELDTRKADLDRQASVYQALYDQLSQQERQQAIAEQEERDAAAARTLAVSAAPTAADPTPAGATGAVGDPPAREAAAARDRTEQPIPGGSQAAQAAIAAALSKVGSAYVWGAAGPDSFDCSGLTSWAWNQAGVTIPRTSREQEGLTPVPMDQLQPGDLVTYYSPVSHVAMYIGNGQVVQASTPSKPVYVTDVYRGGPNPTGHRPKG